MKKIVDIDLENLPKGTKVKIVDKWRRYNGLQNTDGGMDEFLGQTLIIEGNYTKGNYIVDNNAWVWYPEMFKAIQLPDSDIWYEVAFSPLLDKYLIDEDVDIKPEEVIPVKQPESKYMVYVSGKASPNKVHNTYESACKEAERLAGKEVGYVVSVCKVERQFIAKVIVECLNNGVGYE